MVVLSKFNNQIIGSLMQSNGILIPSDADAGLLAFVTDLATGYGTIIGICDGTDDYVQFQAVHDALGSSYVTITAIPGVYDLGATGLVWNKTYSNLNLNGSNIKYDGTGVAIDIAANRMDWCDFNLGHIEAYGTAASNANARGIRISGLNHSRLRAHTQAFFAGASLEMLTVSGTTRQVEANEIWLWSRSDKRGIVLTGDYSFMANHLRRFDYLLWTDMGAGAVGIDASANTQDATVWKIDYMRVWSATELAGSGIKGTGLIDSQIDLVVDDSLGQANDEWVLFDGMDNSVHVNKVVLYLPHASAKLRSLDNLAPTIDEVWDDTSARFFSTIGHDLEGELDHSWAGKLRAGTAGEALAFPELCYLKSDGKYWKTDSDAAATTDGELVVATGTISQDAAGTFIVAPADIRDDTWAFTTGDTLYVDVTAGDFTATAPSGSGDQVRVVGFAITDDVIHFAPSGTIVEIT